jgi:RNA polymerase sigma-70 factor (ECF subfamily)
LHRFRFECSFYTWIYRIVTNVCLDQLRRRSSRPEDQAPELAQQANGESSAGDFFDRQQEQGAASNPERRLMGQEIGRRISTALEQLTPRERMVFEMKHYQGLKLRAIGEVLGTTEETVKNSLFRATRKLRLQLEGLL